VTPQDLAAVHRKAFSATRAWSADEFASLLSNAGTFVQGDLDSFALIRVVADEAEVLTLATDPAKRRQGLARTTLRQAMTTAQAQGAASIFLEVAEDNHAARSLYQDAGFSQVGRRPGYYVPKNAAPVAALVMKRALSAV
jgi:ribosomal-protein-alanine N-acetyltransferase